MYFNKRAEDFVLEFRQAQVQLTVARTEQNISHQWKPPPLGAYKLNFDAAVFSGLNRTGIGTIIRNEKGKVMVAMSAVGPDAENSEEAELMACKKSLEFAVDTGFSRLIIEGDNANVIQAISSSLPNNSFLGCVVDDIRHLIHGLNWARTNQTRRGGNTVAHVLAQFARNLEEDLVWIEDSPPPAVAALSHDVSFLYLNESCLFKKKT
nr:uncharacterized protein LOC112040686 [Quercus suber]